MRRLGFIILVSFLLVSVTFVQRGSISTVEASSLISQGDLILTGNNVTVIDGTFDINGSIVVEENATLILQDAIVNFTQTSDFQYNMTFQKPANGNPRLLIENSTIASNYFMVMYFRGNSSATINKFTSSMVLAPYEYSNLTISNSTMRSIGTTEHSFVDLSNSEVYEVIASYRNSTLNMFNCTLHMMDVYDEPSISLSNCTISLVLVINPHSVNCSITNLKPGFVTSWNFKLDCSVVVASDGCAPDLTLTNTKVEGWNLLLTTSNASISHSELEQISGWGTGNVSIYESKISTAWGRMDCTLYMCNSTTNRLVSYEDSKFCLVNSTSGSYEIHDQSKVDVYWYLNLHVTDSIGQDVPAANVTAAYPNTTVADSKLTASNGWAMLTLMEKMMNATGPYPIGNYTVEATYETHSNSITVNMTGNKQITLALDFVIPEFPSFLILPLSILATVLIAIVYGRKKASQALFQ